MLRDAKLHMFLFVLCFNSKFLTFSNLPFEPHVNLFVKFPFRTTARMRTRAPPRGPRGARRRPPPRESTPRSPKLEVGRRKVLLLPPSCNFPRLHECKGHVIHLIRVVPATEHTQKLCKELNSNLEPRKRRRRRRELRNGRSLHLELSNCHDSKFGTRSYTNIRTHVISCLGVFSVVLI